MMLGLKSKLRGCPHTNVGAFDYVRDDGILDEAMAAADNARRDKLIEHLSGLRICLDCGSTQRFRRVNPLAIGEQAETWVQPWMWR